MENISQSCIKQVVVTDTIPLSEAAKKEPKIQVRSVAGLIGRAIQAIHEEASVSKLFIRQEFKLMATATEKHLLEAQPRTPGNKNAARRVRRDGKVPACCMARGRRPFR